MKNETIEIETKETEPEEELIQCEMPDGYRERLLQYIPVDKLLPHPDNPRKELGDLTELADSIRTKGVMQNLTVVPFVSKVNTKFNGTGLYTVIIGHRRCAAAKLAGLTELPCVVVEMTPEEQVATMLLENMQRVDLTPFEQAQGFQMMLDLGDSVNGIAEKTGFSKSTVRRRLKLTELDQKLLQKASARQVSLLDLERLEKIENIKERNRVLREIGTNNFERALQKALEEQKNQKQALLYRSVLAEYGAIEIRPNDKWDTKYRSHGGLQTGIDEDGLRKTLDLLKPKQIYFCIQCGYCYLRTLISENDAKEDADKAARRKAEEERSVRYNALKNAFASAYELRSNFMKMMSKGRGAMVSEKAIGFLLELGYKSHINFAPTFFAELIGMSDDEIESADDTGEIYEKVYFAMCSKPSLTITIFAYASTGDCGTNNCFNYQGEYRKNEMLERIYRFLKKIGYKMSDEEKALMDGTHELYLKEEK